MTLYCKFGIGSSPCHSLLHAVANLNKHNVYVYIIINPSFITILLVVVIVITTVIVSFYALNTVVVAVNSCRNSIILLLYVISYRLSC